MRRQTTTKQLNEAITNNLLKVEKAECHYKSSDRIDEMSAEQFKNDFDFLCESGIFAGFVDWHYERNLSGRGYVVDSGAMNPYSENIVTVYLRVCENANVEDIEKTLLFIEEE